MSILMLTSLVWLRAEHCPHQGRIAGKPQATRLTNSVEVLCNCLLREDDVDPKKKVFLSTFSTYKGGAEKCHLRTHMFLVFVLVLYN